MLTSLGTRVLLCCFLLANFVPCKFKGICSIWGNSAVYFDCPLFRVTSEFEKQVQITLNNTAKIQCALFSMQCFALCEAEKFHITFNHDLQPTRPGESPFANQLTKDCLRNTETCCLPHNAVLSIFCRCWDAVVHCTREVHQTRDEMPFLWSVRCDKCCFEWCCFVAPH